MPHNEFDRTVADFYCNQVALRAVGKRIEVLGWKTLFHVSAADDDEDSKEKKHPQILPPLQNAFRAQVQQAPLKAQRAQPPKRSSEGDLIKAMRIVAKLMTDPRLVAKLKETTGIATDATRASSIQESIDCEFMLKKRKAGW